MVLMVILCGLALAADPAQTNWPSFRGEKASGVWTGPSTPTSWNADSTSGQPANILWKSPVPGLGHSSPIVWGDRVYVASAVRADGAAPLKLGLYGSGDSADDAVEQSWKIFCFNRHTGKLVWEQTAHKGQPKVARHTKATHANTTLATDGQQLIAFFGSEGLYSYSLDGKLLWKKDLGILDMGPEKELQWGFASSPVLHSGKIVVQCDAKQGPFLAVLDARDGQEIWRTSRSGVSERSWATPAVENIGGKLQVITNGWPYIAGYDFATGKELWRLRSEGDIPVPTPVAAHGLLYVTNAHGGQAPLYAIKPSAAGNISPSGPDRVNQHIAWSEQRNGAYMQTPVIYGGLLYSCSDRGVLKVYDARTGKRHYEQRLGEGTAGVSASPVAAAGKLYFTSEEGEVFVIKAGTVFELLARNSMGETVMASPAISEGVLLFRTRGHLVAIAEPRAIGKRAQNGAP